MIVNMIEPFVFCRCVAATMQRRLRKERRFRKRAQDQLDTETAKRKRLEEAMRATAPDILRSIQGKSSSRFVGSVFTTSRV